VGGAQLGAARDAPGFTRLAGRRPARAGWRCRRTARARRCARRPNGAAAAAPGCGWRPSASGWAAGRSRAQADGRGRRGQRRQLGVRARRPRPGL